MLQNTLESAPRDNPFFPPKGTLVMQTMKMMPDALDAACSSTDRWYVTNGATAVGPVNLELLVRGVEAGKVPVSSFVRHEAWKVWRPLSEIAEITIDGGGEVDIGDRPSYEPGRASSEPGRISTDDLFAPIQPVLASDAAPTAPSVSRGVIESAVGDRRDALLLLLAAAVSRGHAEVAMIHEVADDGAVAVCAHGPQVFEALGLRTRLLDPAMIAAAAGVIVISEPTPGPAGQAIIDRLGRLGVAVESGVMLPIRPHGRLYGTIELGRRSAFRPTDVAGLEKLVEALVYKLERIAPGRSN
jgi:GYF domain 2